MDMLRSNMYCIACKTACSGTEFHMHVQTHSPSASQVCMTNLYTYVLTCTIILYICICTCKSMFSLELSSIPNQIYNFCINLHLHTCIIYVLQVYFMVYFSMDVSRLFFKNYISTQNLLLNWFIIFF